MIRNDTPSAADGSTKLQESRRETLINPSGTWRINLSTWLALFSLGLGLWLAIQFAGLILEVVWVIFGAILLSLAIRPLADALTGWHIPRGITVLIVYAGLAGTLALVGILLVPVFSTEATHLQANGPALLQKALSELAAAPLLGRLLPSTSVLAQDLAQRVDTLLRALVGTLASVGGLALDVLVLLVLAYFIASDARMGERVMHNWVPPLHRELAERVMTSLRHRLTRWVWAQLAIALYFATTFSIGLTLLGVPFALTIGLVGGILEIIPYLGGAVAVLLAIVSALTVNPILVLWVVVYYMAVVEVEAHIVAPAFYGRVMGLHPGAVLVALLVGAKAKGVLGVLFAVPVAVVLAAIVQEVQLYFASAGAQLPVQSNLNEAPAQSNAEE